MAVASPNTPASSAKQQRFPITILGLTGRFFSPRGDGNFRDLAGRLIEVEDQLQYARRFYNGAVKQYLTRLQTFPDVLVARLFTFIPAAFFETDDRAAVEVRL